MTIELGGPLKPIQKKIEIDFCVIIGFQLYYKDIRDHGLNQIFYYFDFIQVGSFHTTRTYNKSLRLWDFEVRTQTRLFEVSLTQNLIRPWNIIQCFHVFILSNFLGPFGSRALLCALWNETNSTLSTDERFCIQMVTCSQALIWSAHCVLFWNLVYDIIFHAQAFS